jgi:hypothetical protein
MSIQIICYRFPKNGTWSLKVGYEDVLLVVSETITTNNQIKTNFDKSAELNSSVQEVKKPQSNFDGFIWRQKM